MATSMLQAPRPSTSAGTPLKMSLPTIEHPMSKRNDRGDMTVRGDLSSLAFHRQKTFVAMGEGGKVHLGLDRSGLPPMTSRSGSGSDGVQTRQSCSGDFAGRIHSGRGKYRKPIDGTPQLSATELEQMIQEKLSNGQHGMKHLFRSNDPNGQGTVTREGLLKILYNMAGYITADTFSKLLKRMNLDHRTQIAFDDFVAHFKEKQVKHTHWFSPAQKIEVQKKPNPEEHLRMPENYHFRDPRITASTCHTLLRDRLRQRGHDMLFVFPESCRGRHSLILPQHLVAILEQLDINVTESDFHKLWMRYDKEAVGSVKRSQLFSMLGLDDVGNIVIPRITSESNLGNPFNTPTGSELHLDQTGSPSEAAIQIVDTPKETKIQETSRQREVLPSSRSKRSVSSVISVSRKRGAPKLDFVIDALHFKFEEGYYSLIMGLQCFDFLGDGLISRLDFKRVLDEFGMKMAAMDFDHFFTKIGVKCSHSQVPYKDFLMKFWNKGESGLVNRIVTKNTHIFVKGGSLPAADVDLTEEQLEAKLVDFLHKDFLQLLNSLKKSDKYKIGVVTRHEFRDAIDRALGYTMSDRQWTSVKNTLPLDSDGLVMYPKFLEMFATTHPGKWNTQDIGGVAVTNAQRNTPRIVDKLREDSDKDLHKRQNVLDELKEDTSEHISIELKNKVVKNIDDLRGSHRRPLKQLSSMMKEFFKQRFNDADKAFKLIDRRMTGRISKHQFGDILKQCDTALTAVELDDLWITFKLGPDGMASFTSLINHYNDFGQSGKQTIEHIPGKDPEFKDKLKTLREQFNLSTAGSRREGGPQVSQSQGNSSSQGPDLLNDILNKIKPLAHKHWGHLKSIFRHADREGQAYIHGSDMQDIMQMLHFPLNPVEMRRLLRAFDTKKDGHFHYIDFLKLVGGKKDSDQNTNMAGNQRTILSDRDFQQNDARSFNRRNTDEIPFVELLASMKEKVFREQKAIRKAFKKADLNVEGCLCVKDFKNVLKSCGFKITPEDLYHILSEFDSNMDGRIFYEEFLAQILGKV